jgi:UDP-N-acetylmuramate--alanine ligase
VSVLGQARRVHFIGVGGIGMSGIAELLVNLGFKVSGSDMQRTDITDRLESLGARVTFGHDARNVSDAEVVVYSSAVRATNPEIAAARARGVAVVPRAVAASARSAATQSSDAASTSSPRRTRAIGRS